jgi:hypothetical protein
MKEVIPHLTLIGPWDGDDTWTVTLGDYDPTNHYDVCTQRRFNTKEEAEAFIRSQKGPWPEVQQ